MRTRRAPTLAAILLLGTCAHAAHWTGIGPYGGIVSDVVVDPQTPSTVYAVTAGGVFRSTDSGATWVSRSAGISRFSYPEGFGNLAIDPQVPSTLYLVRALNPDTLLKSIDAGATWTRTSLGGLDNSRAVAVHPQAHDTIYVMAIGSVAVSGDGGITWRSAQVVRDADTQSLALDPVDPAIAYVAAAFGIAAGVYKTTDGGLTWQPHNAGLTTPDVIAVVTDPFDPLVVHAASVETSFHSADGGATWTEAAVPVTCIYYNGLRTDPATPQRLWAATCNGVYASADGGVTWAAATTGITLQSILTVGPGQGGVVYAGTEGHGVFRSADAGTTWAPRTQGISAHAITAIVTHPTSAATIYAGTQRQGIMKTTDGGATWTRADAGITYPGPDTVDVLALDPQTPATVYTTVGGHLFKSVDAGASWNAMESGLPPGRYVRTVAVDPQTPTTLYVGVDAPVVGVPLIYKSIDAAASWAATPIAAAPGLLRIGVIAVDPVTSSNVYAGGAFTAVVVRSTDGGASWTPVSVSSSGYRISALAVDAQNPSTVYAGTVTAGLHRSLDGGVSWSPVPGVTFEVQALTVDAMTSARVFASVFGSASNVLASLDGGGSFSDVTGDMRYGLSGANVPALVLDPQDPTRLLAGTTGGGVQVGLLVPCALDADCAVAGDLCQVPTCAPSGSGSDAFGCSITPRQCPTPEECHAEGICDPDTGACSDDLLPDGYGCPDDATDCTVDTCHAGQCRHDVALATNCFDPISKGGSTLTLRQTSPAKARLAWKWGRGEAFGITSQGNPFEVNRTGYELCIADHGGAAGTLRLVLSAQVPAGGTCGVRSCWSATNGLDIAYRDRVLSADGIRQIRLHPGIAGQAKVQLSGSGPNLDVATAPPLAPGVVVELHRNDAPVCWQATFDQLVRRNQSGLFVAKSGEPTRRGSARLALGDVQ